MSMALCNLVVSGLIIFILHQTPLVAAQPPMQWQLCSYTSGNYTANSTYRENIQNLATFLPDYASTSPYLFAAGKSGTIPDAIYALALCRGDTNASSCALCVAAAIRAAQDLCALVKEVTIYDDPCILRFSNQDFPHNPLDNRGKFVAFGGNVSAVVAPAFFAAVGRLVNATAKFAAADQIRRFGTGEEAFDKTYPKIYALAQCTPDMTADDCWTCLMNISSKFMPAYFYGKPGGRVFGVRCNFRFQTYSLFHGQPLVHLLGPFAPPPSSAPQPAGSETAGAKERKRARRTAIVVAIVVLISAAVLITLVTWHYFWKWSKKRAAKALQPNATSSDDIPSINYLLLDLSTLQVATDDIAEDKRLGEGGFGVVYKGDLPEGQEIAVKRLSKT